MVSSLLQRNQVFNVNPKLYKSDAEIDADLSGAFELKIALAELSKLGIKNVLQGDLMYTDDTSEETMNGTSISCFNLLQSYMRFKWDPELGKIIKSQR